MGRKPVKHLSRQQRILLATVKKIKQEGGVATVASVQQHAGLQEEHHAFNGLEGLVASGHLKKDTAAYICC